MMYAISSTILIACLSFSLGALIRILSDQVHDFCNHQGDNRKKNSNESGDESIKKLLILEMWKSQYLFIQRLIEQLNDVFDCILLIVISSTDRPLLDWSIMRSWWLHLLFTLIFTFSKEENKCICLHLLYEIHILHIMSIFS